ncbi:MAG: DNA polymerase III subunit epsilon [Alphaproteobacteria bacterium]
MREIVFDTETTGLSAQGGHRIFEIGMVELDSRMPTGRTFHHYLDPERELSPDSIRITGVTDAQLVGKPYFRDIAADLLAFVGDSPLIAHNAGFDMSFLNNELSLLGFEPLSNTVKDTLGMARKLFPGSRHTLDALCKRFNVSLHNEREFHGALLDARLLAEVYVELTGGLQGNLLGGTVTEVTVTETVVVESISVSALLTRAPLVLEPTADEAAAHAAAVAKLKQSLWVA